MNSVIIKDYPNYQIFEDRRIRNIKFNKFLVVKSSVYLRNEHGTKNFSVRKLMQQAGFNTAPQIEGVKHKTIKDYPHYQIYSNGLVWDSFHGRWKKFANDTRGHLSVHLTNDCGFKNFQVHRLVYEAFVGTIPSGYIIHHLDQNPQNNCIVNLKLMTNEEHTAFHKEGNTYKRGRKQKQQTKEKISKTLKKYWEKRKQ